jgi:hypothetical protein
MDSGFVVELIGYLGSAMIVISLTRTSLLKLRLFGLVGAAFFVAYSLIIKAYPIAVVNVVIVGIHLFFLRDLLSKKTEFFTTLEVRADSRILAYFLEFNREDIHSYREDYVYEPREDQVRVFILRDLVPAGLLIGRPCATGTSASPSSSTPIARGCSPTRSVSECGAFPGRQRILITSIAWVSSQTPMPMATPSSRKTSNRSLHDRSCVS